jgi:hypothetical protein
MGTARRTGSHRVPVRRLGSAAAGSPSAVVTRLVGVVLVVIDITVVLVVDVVRLALAGEFAL